MNAVNHIIAECRAGRETGWRALYSSYAGYVFTVCRRYGVGEHDLADTVQEVFAQVFKSIKTFAGGGEALKPWLRGITVNVCLTYLRKQRRGRVVYLEKYAEETGGVDNDGLSRLGTEEIIKLISALPATYRTVFNMAVIDGYSYVEIAEQLGLTESNCRQYLSRARATLRNQIEVQNAPRRHDAI